MLVQMHRLVLLVALLSTFIFVTLAQTTAAPRQPAYPNFWSQYMNNYNQYIQWRMQMPFMWGFGDFFDD